MRADNHYQQSQYITRIVHLYLPSPRDLGLGGACCLKIYTSTLYNIVREEDVRIEDEAACRWSKANASKSALK